MQSRLQHHLQIEVADAPAGPAFLAEVTLPATAAMSVTPATTATTATTAMPAARGAPLALLSHGNGGSHQIYRALCVALVQAGWALATLDHPGNNRRDNRLAGTPQNLADRPRHIRRLLDAVLSRADTAAAVDPQRIAVIGHSMGSYTALAVAGGQPYTPEGDAVPVQADPRVGALVLLAPAAAWFQAPDALRAVTVPILMLLAEHDPITPAWQADVVLHGVAQRSQVTLRAEPGAGHFSFISPFPPAMRRPGFPPANDPDGFDREAFHQRYPAEVVAWLNHVLPAS